MLGWLLVAAAPVVFAQNAVNTATIAPPAGVIDPNGGCTGSPPVCTGNNTATDSDPIVTVSTAKSASPASGQQVARGATITYTLTVTVAGAATPRAIVLTDTLGPGLVPGAAPAGCAFAGQVLTCTLASGAAVGPHAFVYTATVSSTATGSVGNQVTADAGTCTACTTSHPILPATSTVAKTANPASGQPVLPNGTIAYALVLTVSGSNTTQPTTLTDTLGAGLTLASGPDNANCSAAGQVITCVFPTGTAPGTYTVNYTATVANNATGTVGNSVTATNPPGGDPDPTCTSCTTGHPVNSVTSQTLVKQLTGQSATPAVLGTVLSYSVTLTNTGTTTFASVTVSDPLLTPGSITCPNVLPAGTCVLTGTHTVTQANVDAGQVVNIAISQGPACPTAGVGPNCSSTVTTPIAQTPALTLDKQAPTGSLTVGSTLTYVVVATNSGNTTQTNVVVSDPMLTPSSATCATLAPGATCTLTGTYVVTQANVDAGQIVNTAQVVSTQVPTPVEDTETTPIAQTPALTIAKTAGTPTDVNGNGLTDAGDTIAYSFVVTNSGTVTVDNIAVNDLMLSATPLACAITTLAPGASTNCGPVTYTVTEADVQAGSVDNSATAQGTAPGGAGVVSPPDTTSTPTTGAGIASVVKTSDPASGGTVSPGQTISYTLTTTVEGYPLTQALTLVDTLSANQTLVGVTSPGAYACTGALTCVLPAGTAPGSYAVTYTATVNANATGSVGNSVVASNPPGGDPDPRCDACTTTHDVVAPTVLVSKASDPASGGFVLPGQAITYTLSVEVQASATTGDVVLVDTLSGQQTLSGAAPAGCTASGNGLACTLPAGSLPGTYTFVYTTTVDAGASGAIGNSVVATGNDNPECSGCVTTHPIGSPAISATKTATLTTDNGTPGVGNIGDVITYAVTVRNAGNVPLTDITVLDSFEGRAPTTLTCTPTSLAPGETATCASYTHVITAEDASSNDDVLENVVTATGLAGAGGGQAVTVTATSAAVVRIELVPATVRIVKSASPRDVKPGDLVRYTLVMQNTGPVDVVDGTLVDQPPAGFNYVEGSLTVADRDGVGALAGRNPIRVDRIDIAAGERATITYLLRVGAGVRAGIHTNSAYLQDDGETVSNIATADVQLVADPMLDESLILGTVFDDRDGDGWQDSAAMTGVHVQGGFAPGAYVANSTTVDRGNGPAPEADASSPLLHGIAIGKVDGRQSDADPVARRQVVVSQTLRSLDFADDFVLSTDEGVTVRMDAAGNTRVERSGDAAKGLTAASPTVVRRVSQVADGYVVDYVIGNEGVDERGIPGVRIASVEGLLVETDQFGRYHLAGIDGGLWERGRNFVLKVDPATLPPGSEFTTDNPLLRRITPGLPVRFDFGVRLPSGLVEGGRQDVEIELGEVMFDAESAVLREAYAPVIDAIADKVRANGAGEVVIAANGESQGLAYERAKAVQAALLAKLSPEQADSLAVSLRTDLADPRSTLLSLGESPVLGTVLFDTDKSTIRPEFEEVIGKIAADIEKLGGGVIGVVGHADRRGSLAYNDALGLRRAKAVYEAVAAKLGPEARGRLRVEISDDPTAPVGIRGQ